jgi:tRNA(His) 5'-end guanylyltransferase
MKSRELFSGLSCVPPVFVRLDGRNFHGAAEAWNLEQPFDQRFSGAMTKACIRLMADSGLSPDFAYTFSDEINLYFSQLPFTGRVEKIDSVAASYTASVLMLEMQSEIPVSFDARIIQVTPGIAVQYLIERQAEAWRNHINAYCLSILVDEGMSRKAAAKRLKGLPSPALHELMFSHGINLAKTPAWQRRGILVYKKGKTVEGWNPVLSRFVQTIRTTIVSDHEPPVFSSPEGRSFLTGLIGEL